MAWALFETGADPEARDGHGQKPLDYAISAANQAFIEAALNAGADRAGGRDALQEAQGETRSCSAFARSPAYRRLMLASARRD